MSLTVDDSSPIPDTPLQRHLVKINACMLSRVWAGARTARDVWQRCDQLDWLLWWASNTAENASPCGLRVKRALRAVATTFVSQTGISPALSRLFEIASGFLYYRDVIPDNVMDITERCKLEIANFEDKRQRQVGDSCFRMLKIILDVPGAKFSSHRFFITASQLVQLGIAEEACDVFRANLSIPWTEEQESTEQTYFAPFSAVRISIDTAGNGPVPTADAVAEQWQVWDSHLQLAARCENELQAGLVARAMSYYYAHVVGESVESSGNPGEQHVIL